MLALIIIISAKGRPLLDTGPPSVTTTIGTMCLVSIGPALSGMNISTKP